MICKDLVYPLRSPNMCLLTYMSNCSYLVSTKVIVIHIKKCFIDKTILTCGIIDLV